ncbi:hypothetical protein [Rhodoblastus sp.]|jgi:hypothetical protein|uniref:hypothetical protein n=1 Tax=Rhodoblastus sp. TaxID=1962975 RepID=UPI0025EBEBC2|nr:hypothetical protein [Rhodoblastus sp.]
MLEKTRLDLLHAFITKDRLRIQLRDAQRQRALAYANGDGVAANHWEVECVMVLRAYERSVTAHAIAYANFQREQHVLEAARMDAERQVQLEAQLEADRVRAEQQLREERLTRRMDKLAAKRAAKALLLAEDTERMKLERAENRRLAKIAFDERVARRLEALRQERRLTMVTA